MLDSGFDKFGAVFFYVVHHVGWNVLNFIVLRFTGLIPDPGFAGEQVNHAYHVVLDTNGENHDERFGCEHGFNLIYNAVKIGAGTVELIDKDNTGNSGVVCVAPVGLGLRLNTTRSTEYTYATVKNLK